MADSCRRCVLALACQPRRRFHHGPYDDHVVTFTVPARPHTLGFRVSSRFDTGGGGLAYFDAISLIPTRQATWPPAAPVLQLIPRSGGQMGVTWETVPGFFYRLEDSGDLGAWTQPGPFQAPLTRRAEIVTLPASAPAHFFRTKFSSTTFAPGP
jgi:hypothetical protein